MATADQILARVLVRCGWPATNAPLSSAEILALADDEITGTLWPQLLSTQGDWHLAYVDTALVADQAAYRLPARMWGPIKDLLLVDSQGEAKSLRVCNIEELGRMDVSAARGVGVERFYAYLDGDSIGLFPTPGSADTSYSLRVRYYRAPNALCLESAARRVFSVNGADSFTLYSTVSWSFASIDFIGGGASHQLLLSGATAISVVGTTMTTSGVGASDADIDAEDWVSLTGTTPLAQIPDHMVPQLVSRVAQQCLNSVGDQAGFARVSAMANQSEVRVLPTISPRQEAEPNVIMPRNSPFMRWRR